jgi:hypothetical protein
LTTFGFNHSLSPASGVLSVAHAYAGLLEERLEHVGNHLRVDERQIALDVDDDVARKRARHLGYPIGSSDDGYRGHTRPPSRSTASAMRASSVATTTGPARRGGRAPVDVRDHGPAVDVGEWLFRESA